jgi:hypothetical protein
MSMMMTGEPVRTDPADAHRGPSARIVVEIALVCGLVAVITAGVALWSLSSALTPSRAEVSTMVSQRLDGPGPLRHELAREDGPVVQTLVDGIETNQQQYLERRRGAIVRAVGFTALVGAILAALAGWFGASRAKRHAIANRRPDLI